MMRWIVASSLKFRWLVLFAAAATMAFGFVDLRGASVDVFPEFAPPRVEIQTIAIGNSSTEVEELITTPMEEQLAGIEGVKELRSKSVVDLSSITLIFERGANQEKIRQLVAERVAQLTPSLPTWASPPVIMPALSSTSRVLKIGLSSDTISQMELSRISYWLIRQKLLRVPGVANVAIWGEQLQQLHVQLDPKKLAVTKLTTDEVMDTTAQALDTQVLRYTDGSVIGTGGFVEENGFRFPVRSKQAINDEKTLADVPITNREGKTFTLGDLGKVLTTYGPTWGDGVVNDQPGILLVIQKFPDTNTLEITKGIEAAMHELEPALQGIEVDTTIFRPATFIQSAIDNLSTSLLIGIGLVVLILIAFLMEWRTMLISLVSIPLSLVAALVVLDQFDQSINVMVLAGLVVSIGVVVDDAIIDVENIVRRIRESTGTMGLRDIARIVVDASVEVRSAIIYATLIDVVAIIPVFFLGGLSGAFFQPLVLAYGVAVMASLGVALTVTPAMCYLLLRKGDVNPKEPWLLHKLKAGYTRLLTASMRNVKPAMALLVLCLVAGAAVAPTLGQSLLPNFKERDFLMHWLTPPGTSQTEETRISVRGCRDLREIPGVRNCGSHIGQALLADEVYGVYFGENWISISEDVDYNETLGKVQRLVESYPGIYRDVQTYLRERVKEVLTGTSEAIVVRISGPDLAVLEQKANEIASRIKDVPGISEAHASFLTNVPHIAVEVDSDKAAKYGLKPGDVRRQAATMVASEEVGDLFQGGRAFDVHVWSTPETRASVTAIGELPIDTADGRQIQLKDVASVTVKPTPNAIERVTGSRKIDVGANVKGADLSAVVTEVKKRLDGVQMPAGVHLEVIGEASEFGAAQGRLLAYGLAAGVVIFMLLQAAAGSTRVALLLFAGLPMALVGAILAARFTGGVISLGSLVGFLTVFGIAARNGILMTSHFHHLEQHEGVAFDRELVIRGAAERLAPILMTASATGLALMPLIMSGDLPGHEIEYPMAVVILGGLVTSTLLNLFVLPSLYLKFGKSRRERAAAV
ncbi:MAG: efflux RND transporter permease subunit [Micropruina sp.]|nr:efflux RND transporter permease subunit [Micropruina sp.]